MMDEIQILNNTKGTLIKPGYHRCIKVMTLNTRGIRKKWLAIDYIIDFDYRDIFVITETKLTEKARAFKGYEVFQSLEDKKGGVFRYANTELKPRLLSIYANQQVSIQISDDKYRYFIIGAYVHQNSDTTWQSIKSEVNNLRKLYLNPKIIIA